jgi:hypothetical protein
MARHAAQSVAGSVQAYDEGRAGDKGENGGGGRELSQEELTDKVSGTDRP